MRDRAFSCVSWVYIQFCKHMWISRPPGMSEPFKAFYLRVLPNISPTFFGRFWFVSVGFPPQGVGMSKLDGDFFGPTRRDGASHCESSKSVK